MNEEITYVAQEKDATWTIFKRSNTNKAIYAPSLKSALKYVVENNDIVDFRVMYYKGYSIFQKYHKN